MDVEVHPTHSGLPLIENDTFYSIMIGCSLASSSMVMDGSVKLDYGEEQSAGL